MKTIKIPVSAPSIALRHQTQGQLWCPFFSRPFRIIQLSCEMEIHRRSISFSKFVGYDPVLATLTIDKLAYRALYDP
jgi:hypothetical protein